MIILEDTEQSHMHFDYVHGILRHVAARCDASNVSVSVGLAGRIADDQCHVDYAFGLDDAVMHVTIIRSLEASWHSYGFASLTCFRTREYNWASRHPMTELLGISAVELTEVCGRSWSLERTWEFGGEMREPLDSADGSCYRRNLVIKGILLRLRCRYMGTMDDSEASSIYCPRWLPGDYRKTLRPRVWARIAYARGNSRQGCGTWFCRPDIKDDEYFDIDDLAAP